MVEWVSGHLHQAVTMHRGHFPQIEFMSGSGTKRIRR